MKKYYVVREYTHSLPSVLFACDDYDDAKQFATVMSHQDGYAYTVAEVEFRIQA